MIRVVLLILAGVLLLGSGCGVPGTRNVGSAAGPEWFKLTVTVPAGMVGGVDATWSATWNGGVGPYTILWDFGGGADNIGPVTATSPDTRAVIMRNPSLTDVGDYTCRVTVTDSNGNQAVAGGRYSVGFGDWPPPSILSVSYMSGILTVSVSSPSGDDVTVYPSEVAGLNFHPESVVVTGGFGDAVFEWEADNILTGGSGTTTITAVDQAGRTDTVDQAVFLEGLTYFEPDTLYVIPAVSHAAVGEPVTLVCITGEIPHPFQFLNGVGVTIEEDADYVANSFNVGMPGGGAGDVDGSIWTAVGPGGFLLADNLIRAVPSAPGNSIPEGRERWSFNLTGLGGSDITNGRGVLFNFQFTFSEPGLKRIGLQQVDGVSRTYYSDGAGNEYFWGTLMADEHGNLNVSGVDNSVLAE